MRYLNDTIVSVQLHTHTHISLTQKPNIVLLSLMITAVITTSYRNRLISMLNDIILM